MEQGGTVRPMAEPKVTSDCKAAMETPGRAVWVRGPCLLRLYAFDIRNQVRDPLLDLALVSLADAGE